MLGGSLLRLDWVQKPRISSSIKQNLLTTKNRIEEEEEVLINDMANGQTQDV